MSDFDFEFPEEKQNKEEVKAKIKGMFSYDQEKGGMMAKIFIFVKKYGPVSSTLLTPLLISHYTKIIDKDMVYQNMKKMAELGVLNYLTSGDVLFTPSELRNSIEKIIYDKHMSYLETNIPKQFRNNYSGVYYFYVSQVGEELIEWCCNLLKIKIKKKE